MGLWVQNAHSPIFFWGLRNGWIGFQLFDCVWWTECADFDEVYDGGRDYIDNGGFGVSKNWITVRDDKVRETHSYLEGQSVPLEEEFFTFDGDHAAYPGGFTKAENNVNCRCIVRLTTDE